jgi:hypothetical protein
MDEDIYKKLVEKRLMEMNYYIPDNNNFNYIREKIRDEIEMEIKRISMYNRPIVQTDEEKLDSIDITVIEKYLRKKKLNNIQKK